jgi:hypothetical protein
MVVKALLTPSAAWCATVSAHLLMLLVSGMSALRNNDLARDCCGYCQLVRCNYEVQWDYSTVLRGHRQIVAMCITRDPRRSALYLSGVRHAAIQLQLQLLSYC